MAFVYSKVGLVCILCTTACLLAQGESEWRAPATAPSTLPFVPYPEWAHFHWVWLTHSYVFTSDGTDGYNDNTDERDNT